MRLIKFYNNQKPKELKSCYSSSLVKCKIRHKNMIVCNYVLKKHDRFKALSNCALSILKFIASQTIRSGSNCFDIAKHRITGRNSFFCYTMITKTKGNGREKLRWDCCIWSLCLKTLFLPSLRCTLLVRTRDGHGAGWSDRIRLNFSDLDSNPDLNFWEKPDPESIFLTLPISGKYHTRMTRRSMHKTETIRKFKKKRAQPFDFSYFSSFSKAKSTLRVHSPA